MSNYKELLAPIKTFIFDYDGVLTDGSVLILPDGEAIRGGNVKDGYAIQYAIKKGYRIVVISGGKSESMFRRLEMLQVKDAYLGVVNKLDVFKKFIADNGLDPAEVIYMGDDIPDYEVMQEVGLPCCPEDAAEEIKSIAKYISHFKGGKGCVRDIIEQVMKLHGTWMTPDAYHW